MDPRSQNYASLGKHIESTRIRLEAVSISCLLAVQAPIIAEEMKRKSQILGPLHYPLLVQVSVSSHLTCRHYLLGHRRRQSNCKLCRRLADLPSQMPACTMSCQASRWPYGDCRDRKSLPQLPLDFLTRQILTKSWKTLEISGSSEKVFVAGANDGHAIWGDLRAGRPLFACWGDIKAVDASHFPGATPTLWEAHEGPVRCAAFAEGLADPSAEPMLLQKPSLFLELPEA